jgi:hypothetical protein
MIIKGQIVLHAFRVVNAAAGEEKAQEDSWLNKGRVVERVITDNYIDRPIAGASPEYKGHYAHPLL